MTMTDMTYDELVENFEYLEDWEERYRYVIELGKALDPLPEGRKTDATKVDGCVSRVWIDSRAVPDDRGGVRVEFDGDSDAHIVRGLIAILHTMLSGRHAKEIIDTDVAAELQRLDLSAHLSPQRSNGLGAMIERIKGFSAQNAA
jgi:cysteine desulfuration protein SufE